MKIKLCLLLLLSLFTTSCILGGKAVKESTPSQIDQNENRGDAPEIIKGALNIQLKRGTSVRTFNEFNKALSNATDIELSNTSDEFKAVQNKLPPTNDVEKFSEFGQVSATRLAFAFCDKFVDKNKEFKDFNYQGNKSDELSEMLMTRFLDYEKGKSSIYDYSIVKSTLLQILENKEINGLRSIPNAQAGNSEVNKRLTKMGCTAILASAYYTVL